MKVPGKVSPKALKLLSLSFCLLNSFQCLSVFTVAMRCTIRGVFNLVSRLMIVVMIPSLWLRSVKWDRENRYREDEAKKAALLDLEIFNEEKFNAVQANFPFIKKNCKKITNLWVRLVLF